MVLTGSHPFDKLGDKSDNEIKQMLLEVADRNKDGGARLDEFVFDERVEGLSASCIELMRQLLHPDPQQRMTSEDFLRHPWVQGLTASHRAIDHAHEKHLRRRFKTNILKRFGGGSEGCGGDEARLRTIFNAIDIAGNGILDLNELRIVLRSAGEPEDAITSIVGALGFERHGKMQGVSWDKFQTIMNMKE